MDISTLNIIISAVTGLIAGTIGSLFAPWVQWAVEKKRRRFEARSKMLVEARAKVEAVDFGPGFLESGEYARLRPYLSDKSVEVIEWRRPLEARDGDRKKLLLDEIAKLEREWELS